MKLRLFFRRLFFGITILSLLLAGSIIYFEVNKDRLLTDLKMFTQAQLSETTGKNVVLGNLEGGVFSGITLNKLVITQPANDNTVEQPIFEAKQLILNYRYWDIILGRFDRLRYIRLRSPVLYLNPAYFNSGEAEKGILLGPSNLFLGRYAKNKILVFVDDGSIALNKKRILFSEINGRIFASEDAIECSLLEGQGLGAKINFKGLVTKLDQDVPQINLALTIDGNRVKGFCQIQDRLREPLLIGAFNFDRNKKLDFSGRLFTGQRGVLGLRDFLINNKHILNAEIDIAGKDGYLIIGDQHKNNVLEVTLSTYSDFSFLSQSKFNHLQLLGHDLLTNLVVMGNWSTDESKTFLGYVASSGTIIDYSPVDELELVFQIFEKSFTLNSLKFGNSYEIAGNIGLSEPYPVDLSLTITRAKASDLLIFAKNKIEKETVTGQFNGRFEVNGPLNDLETKGHLESRDGNIGTIKYETANINFKGRGSVIYLDSSRVFLAQEGKYLALDGFIDLAKIGSGDLLQDLKIYSDEKTILWSGWDITKRPEETKLSFQKEVGNEFKVGFSTFINDEIEDDFKADKDAVELQYNISQNRSLKLKLKENEEIIGMEHKFEF